MRHGRSRECTGLARRSLEQRCARVAQSPPRSVGGMLSSRMRTACLLVAPFVVSQIIACGGRQEPSPPNTVSGSVGAATLQAESALVLLDNPVTIAAESDGGTPRTISTTDIWITNKPDTCPAVRLPGSTHLELIIGGTGPGSYPISVIPKEGSAVAELQPFGDRCVGMGLFVGGNGATGGTVNVTASSASTVSGSFDLTFREGQLTGGFEANVCAGFGLVAADGGPFCPQ